MAIPTIYLPYTHGRKGRTAGLFKPGTTLSSHQIVERIVAAEVLNETVFDGALITLQREGKSQRRTFVLVQELNSASLYNVRHEAVTMASPIGQQLCAPGLQVRQTGEQGEVTQAGSTILLGGPQEKKVPYEVIGIKPAPRRKKS